MDATIIDDCSPHLAASLIDEAGNVPGWFSEAWEKFIEPNAESSYPQD